ncbi:UDP-glycosyltransferase [Melia azedarach]|uniref:UDP-glycosyltransferase n=1 Tax=Melia azedarach TaxID=155640 RepID=A0ACC1YPK7_MELAZ|nr:UDP-glycosyltransferase [Melia azedarach]
MRLLNINCRATFHECLLQMMKQQHARDEIVCIIYDEFMYFSEAAANQLKLQSIILRTSSATTQISREVLKLTKEGYTPLQDPRLQDPVPGLYPLRFKDLPIAKSGISENYLRSITSARNVRTSSAVIWNTINCIEQSSLVQVQQECQVPIFPVGPLHTFAPSSSSSLLEEDTSCISWLINQAPNSVIYISLGSRASIDKKELEEMAWGLVNSKQPFLWVIRPGSTTNAPQGIELLPEGIKEAVGENGCIVKWAPQKVLSHVAVGGFWSHCGWNSTLESIGEGVPMICRPNFGNQTVNARYVSQIWRIGLGLENELERGEVEKAVRKLKEEKEGEERQRAKYLKKKG